VYIIEEMTDLPSAPHCYPTGNGFLWASTGYAPLRDSLTQLELFIGYILLLLMSNMGRSNSRLITFPLDFNNKVCSTSYQLIVMKQYCSTNWTTMNFYPKHSVLKERSFFLTESLTILGCTTSPFSHAISKYKCIGRISIAIQIGSSESFFSLTCCSFLRLLIKMTLLRK